MGGLNGCTSSDGKEKGNDTGVASITRGRSKYQLKNCTYFFGDNSWRVNFISTSGSLRKANQLVKKLYVDVGSEVKEDTSCCYGSSRNYFAIGWGGIPLEIIGGNLHSQQSELSTLARTSKTPGTVSPK